MSVLKRWNGSDWEIIGMGTSQSAAQISGVNKIITTDSAFPSGKSGDVTLTAEDVNFDTSAAYSSTAIGYHLQQTMSASLPLVADATTSYSTINNAITNGRTVYAEINGLRYNYLTKGTTSGVGWVKFVTNTGSSNNIVTYDSTGALTQEATIVIQNAGDVGYNDFATYSSNTVGSNLQETRKDIANIFSASTAYSAGDYVWYGEELYRFISDHAAGAWSGSDATAIKLANDVAELKNKADPNGTYPDMTVGNAKQLVATVGVENKVPYNFRTSGGSADIGDREVDKLVGGTVAWNQLFGADESFTLTGLTITKPSTGVYRLNGTLAAAVSTNVDITFTSGHVYLLRSGRPNADYVVLSNTATWDINKAEYIIKPTASGKKPNVYCKVGTYTDVDFKPNIFDLTAAFGSTIADYIYALEQNHAGDGVAWFRKLFPKAYYAYDAGTLMSVKTSAHRMTGFNQWDEQWEQGGMSSGFPVSGTNQIRSKNYCPILPGVTYYGTCGKTDGGNQNKYYLTVSYYDSNKTWIKNEAINNLTFTPPENAAFFKLYTNSSTVVYGGTYHNDICINLHWDGEKDGQYEPYELHSYALDGNLELRGIPKLDTDNKLYYDGDMYASDGTVTRKYGIVDLGTLSWTLNTQATAGYQFYGTGFPSKALVGTLNAVISNGKYTASSTGAYNATSDKIFSLRGGTSTTLWIIDSEIALASALKTSLNGVYLVYELATPTTESADPYTNPQIVDDFGTEEYVDSRDVAIPVGHNTLYQANLRAKLEMAPDSPEGDGDYIVRQTDGENAYVPLALNAGDIAYSGTAAYSDNTAGSVLQEVVGDVSDLKIQITNVDASLSDSESSMTVTHNYPKGSLVTVNGALYKTTAAVASGQTLVSGTNCVLTSISDELDGKADVDGTYPNLTAGNAKQLLSTVGIEDKVPYIFRTSGGSADIGDREVDKLVGGTVAWNQMVKISSIPATKTVKGVTFTNNGDGSVTINGTADSQIGGTDYLIIVSSDAAISGHKYLSFGCPSGGSQSTYYVYDGYVANGIDTGNGWIGSRNLLRLYFLINEGVTINNAKVWPQFFDLTKMFGSTIADYIYALEQNHAGDGVAWFRKLFPKAYYTYDAGTLMSVKTSAHKMTGFNQWDEEWEVGGISGSTGENTAQNNVIRSTNYIQVLPQTVYYLNCTTTGLGSPFYTFYYDGNKNYITSSGGYLTNGTITTPSNACYMRLQCSSTYGTSYHNDICINLHWDGSRDGEYEPYELHSYAFSDIELRGIPKLDANNKLYYDGDTYKDDGTVTRRYGILNLGTLSWAKNSSAPQFYAAPQTPGVQDKDGKNVMCTAYAGGKAYNAVDKTVCLYGNYIWIADTSIEGQTAFNNAMDGVYLVYELATHTTESADPYTNPQIVNDFGTEKYVDAAVAANTRDVAIPVGHDTIYQANLCAKLEMAPDSPDGDGDYIVRQNNGENVYVPLALNAGDIAYSSSATYSSNTVGSNIQEIRKDIANIFSTSTAYSTGDYVWYSEKLYCFTADHAAGAWTGSDVVAAKLANDVASLKSGVGISNALKIALLTLASKVAYIDANGATYYQTLYDALYPPADLVSISAVYTQSGTVYDTDTLNSLKTDLVVTATYSDSSTATVASADYTLSGTLTVGTSTITVSYGGKTTTFNVTVSHLDTSLYNWDFTQGTTDSRQSASATLGGGVTQSSNGLAFSTEDNSWVYLADMSSYSQSQYTIEVDVVDIVVNTSNNNRIINLSNVETADEGYGLFYRSGEWKIADATGTYSASTPLTDIDVFDGKTLKLGIDYPNKKRYLYADNVLVGEYTVSFAKSNGRDKVCLGSDSSATTLQAGSVITGVRLYEGLV